VSEERLKIAVFIDFDNIEIGVKTTLGGQFDVGAVLEAVKERGEVVTKVAYGDWTRATDYGRSMSQHAIHMVQRNLTPGGDKNGADINLALDALEMAFTHSHINAFVIVGGDSDFITLVEKLKQYDRKVFVVGGRSFTSQVMQKNCTEFVAYEDILGVTVRGRHASGRPRALTDIAVAMPLVRRALQLLADREMTPQLGLLKSTLLQLDSSFSERAYGSSSFRDFVEKLAKAGYVVLKGGERSVYVELRDSGDTATVAPAALPAPAGPGPAEPYAHRGGSERRHRDREGRNGGHGRDASRGPAPDQTTGEHAEAPADAPVAAPLGDEPAVAEGVPRLSPMDGYRMMAEAFSRSGANPRFPMYVRQFKQFIKTFDEGFDERRYGFAGILDALRFAQREGLVRLDRDRRGGVRVHPGPQYLDLIKSPEAAPEADVLASIERSENGLLPDADHVPVEPALSVEEAPPAPGPPAFEPTATPTLAAPEAAPSEPPGEPASEDTAAAPVEPAPAPRGTARKRTGGRAAPRAKKATPPGDAVKKRAPRPRAKKS
jgi:uncharacterized LabA/DUF88 family protein